ncbi:hypothetical protein EDB86DRAFT_3247909 [Lactarius hatsudake]|nr:hypothetical protein EDB86DRAFT_3247909 [Lactarius hatsudake]
MFLLFGIDGSSKGSFVFVNDLVFFYARMCYRAEVAVRKLLSICVYSLQLQCMNPRARPPVVVLWALDVPSNVGISASAPPTPDIGLSRPSLSGIERYNMDKIGLVNARVIFVKVANHSRRHDAAISATGQVVPPVEHMSTPCFIDCLQGTSSVHLESRRALAGSGAVFVASGVDTSFTTTQGGMIILWLGPCVVVLSINSSSGSGNGATGTRESMVGAAVLTP